jgi:hypothetical protein
MRAAATFGIGVVTGAASLAGSQIAYRWDFDELTAKTDVIVIAEYVGSDDTRHRSEHPGLKPGLPVVELATNFRILAVLKPDTRAISRNTTQVTLKHYRIDWDEWKRTNPPQQGVPPPGLVNAGSVLDFSDPGPYLLFLTRTADIYEPLSGHAFPTDSVFHLHKFGALRGR